MSNEPFENGSAVIQGTALVNLDFTNDAPVVTYESVPQGTRIYGIINAIDLVQFPSGGVNYGTIVIDTIVEADGTFTLEVPANEKNVTVNFAADDFRADQVQFDQSLESKVFYLPAVYNEVVQDGVLRITELTFIEK
jgi:hypothetical protein